MKAAENVAAAAATHVADDLASCTRSAMADSDINADCWSSKLTLKRSRQVQFRSVDTGVSITALCHKTSTKLYIWAYAHTGWPKNKPQTFVHIFAKLLTDFQTFPPAHSVCGKFVIKCHININAKYTTAPPQKIFKIKWRVLVHSGGMNCFKLNHVPACNKRRLRDWYLLQL